MNNKYGADVRYVTCKRADLKTVPIIDGQIITFLDADGIFYDIEGVRHTVGNFLIVNKLPNTGVDNTLYVLQELNTQTNQINSNICIWSESERLYHKLIPEPEIATDAPDDHWYLRINGKWKFDNTMFYIDDDWDAKDCFVRLQSFISEFSKMSKIIHIVGRLPLVNNVVLDAPIHLDFNNCNTEEYNIQSTKSYRDDWFTLKIINSHGVSNLHATNAWIILDQEPITIPSQINIRDCVLYDSRVDVSGSKNTVTISNNTFFSYDNDVVPIFNSESKIEKNSNTLNLLNNTFHSFSGIQFATFLDENRETILSQNIFIKCVPLLKSKVSTFNLSDNINPGKDTLLHAEIADCVNNNKSDLLNLDMIDSKYLELDTVVKLASKKSARNLFVIGKTFIASDIFLGVADICDDKVIFEIMPNTVTNLKDIYNLVIPKLASLRPMKLGEIVDISSRSVTDIDDVLQELIPYLNDSSVDRIIKMMDFGTMLKVYKCHAYDEMNSTYPNSYNLGYSGHTDKQLYNIDGTNTVIALYQDMNSGKIGAAEFTSDEIESVDVRYVIEIKTEV